MKPALNHKIRIIGGIHRGRRITVPDHEGLRPSPDRVRETLFNWLQWEISGAHILDAFAGSGALGLEALSRGADSVYFIDNSMESVSNLRTILSTWKETHARVQQSDAFRIPPSPTRYDLIFLDPPFAQALHTKAINHFANPQWLKPHGKIYLEMPFPHHELPLPPHWKWHKQSKAGRIYFGLICPDNTYKTSYDS
ncbi:MAG: 16S rRNA (guanine(966)-N(2))-methyltransferase RsmD [Cardiobacteriaceae bacterium]|nr:16S rRNA (guanine(966)-N(2))-methyltransferase RsmD [Cardiobacteriaceae bacterium]